MTKTMTAREWIIAAAENDKPALIEGVKFLYNCREADADGEGDIWIADPQSGHWLSDDDLERVGRALKAGDI